MVVSSESELPLAYAGDGGMIGRLPTIRIRVSSSKSRLWLLALGLALVGAVRVGAVRAGAGVLISAGAVWADADVVQEDAGVDAAADKAVLVFIFMVLPWSCRCKSGYTMVDTDDAIRRSIRAVDM